MDIINAIQENMIAYFRLFANLPGTTICDADIFWFIHSHGEPGNHVLRFRAATPDPDAQIEALFAAVAQHTDQIDWIVFPGDQPADLGDRLERRGMPAGTAGTWMMADLANYTNPAPMPAGFRIAAVHDTATLALWRDVSAAGFGMNTQIYFDAYARNGFGSHSNTLHVIAYQDDEPVSSAMLLLAGGIAGLWDVSTPPTYRRRGYASTLSQFLLGVAKERGYSYAWTWPSRMAQSVYEKVGFQATDFGVREYRWQRQSSAL